MPKLAGIVLAVILGLGPTTWASPPALTRTAAWVVTECREAPDGLVEIRQAVRIRRGRRTPVTVAELVVLPASVGFRRLGLCKLFGALRFGLGSVGGGAVQRIAVSPHGSQVVFEINDEFSSFPVHLAPEEEGIFVVRADGQGLRRLADPSHQQSFLRFPGLDGFNVIPAPSIAFSPSGRQIALSDRGPGPRGEDAVQLVTLDATTGRRRVRTQLPASVPIDFRVPETCCFFFSDEDTLSFSSYANPRGLNPAGQLAPFSVDLDTGRLRRLRSLPILRSLPQGQAPPILNITGGRPYAFVLTLKGAPVNHPPPGAETFIPDVISEVFVVRGKREVLQLTNLGRYETLAGFPSFHTPSNRVYFRSSGNPLGQNPRENCQLFSIDVLGSGLRQLTHFGQDTHPSNAGCLNYVSKDECVVLGPVEDPVTHSVVFDSSCDPLGTNPMGNQLFAVRPNGGGLTQLTDARGVFPEADGTTVAELVGPYGYSAQIP